MHNARMDYDSLARQSTVDWVTSAPHQPLQRALALPLQHLERRQAHPRPRRQLLLRQPSAQPQPPHSLTKGPQYLTR